MINHQIFQRASFTPEGRAQEYLISSPIQRSCLLLLFFSLIFIYLLLLYCFLKYLFEEIGLGYLWWLYICLSAMPNTESQSFGRYK